MILHSIRAELFAARRRTGIWILAACWSVQILVFAYGISYISYVATRSEVSADQAQQILVPLLPANIDYNIVSSFALFGGPVMLIVGAVLAGGDYRWGTLRTFLPRQGHRGAFVLGRLVALAVVMLGMSILTLALSAISALVIGLIDGAPITWPSAVDLARSLGSIWLITTAWGAVGFMLGLVTRGIAAAIGIGLLWTLALETSFGFIASTLKPLEPVQSVLLSKSTGAIAELLGAPSRAAAGIPGLSTASSGTGSIAVLAGYIVVMALISVLVFRQRDIA